MSSTTTTMKPKLNEELLLGLIGELNCGTEKYEEISGALAKFMLSGREPFNTALNYFSRANRINFRDRTFDLCVKDKVHCFGYEWELKNIILQTCLSSIDHLCIYECPTNEQGYSILDKFCKNDLKHLTLFANLPLRYKYFLRYNCKFDTIYSQHVFCGNSSLSEALLIPSKCHKIIISSFADLLHHVPKRVLYLGVEKLIFDCCGFGSYDISRAALKKTSTLLFQAFPNLQYLAAECAVQASFHPMVNSLLGINFNWLNQIPTYISGEILFKIIDHNEFLFRLQRYDGLLPNVKFDYDKSTMTSSFHVHQGFSVNWKIEFAPILQDDTQSEFDDTQSNADSTLYVDDTEEDSTTWNDFDSGDDDFTQSTLEGDVESVYHFDEDDESEEESSTFHA